MSPVRPIKLMITPPQVELSVGGTQAFNAHGGTEPYSFSLAVNASGGNVVAGTGDYTAGASAGEDVVRVTDAAGSTDDAHITVTAPLQLTAPDAVPVGTTTTLQAGGGTPPYSFAFADGGNASGGSVDAGTGVYTAGPKPGVDTVRVTDDAGDTADAQITVTQSLQLSASDDEVVIGTDATLQAAGGTPPYKFAFAAAGNVSGGSVVSDTGAYTAGSSTGTDTLEVTDDAGDTASITVEVKPALQVKVPEDELRKVQLGTPGQEPPVGSDNPSAALKITVATGIEVTLEVVGGVSDYSVQETKNSGGEATDSPEPGERKFTYAAGLTVGANRRSTDTLTITDGQSTPNEATVTVTVTERFSDLAALAAQPDFRCPFLAYHSLHPFLGFSLHDGLVPSPTGVTSAPKMPHIGFGLLQMIGLQSMPSRGYTDPAAAFLGKEEEERGPVVGPFGVYLMGRRSDVGFVIPHISIPPVNFLMPLVILLGESKSLFGSSSVRLPCWSLLGGADERDAACAVPLPFWPFGVNLGCSDPVPLPLDSVVAPTTIIVGMSAWDILGGIIDIVLEYTVALLVNGASAGIGKAVGGKAAKKVGGEVAEKAAKEAAGEGAEGAAAKAFREALESGAPDSPALKAARYAKMAREMDLAEMAAEEVTEEAAESTWKVVGRRYAKELAETIFLEGPIGWVAGRFAKIDDTIRGHEELGWDWWEFGEILPITSPIVQALRPQPPGGDGWWGDW